MDRLMHMLTSSIPDSEFLLGRLSRLLLTDGCDVCFASCYPRHVDGPLTVHSLTRLEIIVQSPPQDKPGIAFQEQAAATPCARLQQFHDRRYAETNSC